MKNSASNALNAAGDAAANAKDSVASAHLPEKASKIADEVTTLVAAKVDALSEAIKARLHKS